MNSVSSYLQSFDFLLICSPFCTFAGLDGMLNSVFQTFFICFEEILISELFYVGGIVCSYTMSDPIGHLSQDECTDCSCSGDCPDLVI